MVHKENREFDRQKDWRNKRTWEGSRPNVERDTRPHEEEESHHLGNELLDESNAESTKQKHKAVKRKNFDDVIRGPPVPQKRNRLSQGIKRKKEENDKIMKRTRFQDWN